MKARTKAQQRAHEQRYRNVGRRPLHPSARRVAFTTTLSKPAMAVLQAMAKRAAVKPGRVLDDLLLHVHAIRMW